MRLTISISFLFLWIATLVASDRLQTTNEPPPNHAGIMLVSTLDGYLTAIDANSGQEKWRYKEGPILKSPTSVQQDFSFIPNPQNGELYVLANRQLSKLPFTIPQLVKTSPCKSSDGILYAGSKKDVWIAINPDTGVHEETVPPQTRNSCPVGHPETIFIGRTEYKISMLDTKTRQKQWNATFIDYSSHLLPTDQKYPFQHFHSSSDGRILTVDVNTNAVRWKKDFRSVIVNLYLLKEDGMHRVPTTSIGMGTSDILDKHVGSILPVEWTVQYLHSFSGHVSTQPQNLLETLFIGESDSGLYALKSFVDKKTDILSKSLGPPLIEGPVDKNSDVQLNADIDGPTYRTNEGEFLVLGHHDVPPLIARTLITHSDVYSARVPFITYVDPETGQATTKNPRLSHLLENGNDLKRLPPAEVDPDEGWAFIFQQAWNKSPYVVLGFFSFVVFLIVLASFSYGRQHAAAQFLSSKNDVSHVSRGSRGSSKRTYSTSLTDEDEAARGFFQIGKLRYDPELVLGKGCEGTKVFKGTFDGRAVAVKRVVSDQIKLIDREIELLRKSDTHRNVVRYFCSETDDNFFYIALELCECTLNDYVRSKITRDLYKTSIRDILKQATDGVAHLHSINIVHRDLKPHNILLSTVNNKGHARVMISDFGLCKQVKRGHASVSKVSGLAGTDGWMAPEVIRSDAMSVTYAVDVFSLGCVFYFVISEGKHPFGESYRRQDNILQGEYHLEHLISTSDYVSLNAIEKMIELDPERRPPAHAVVNHPIFWSEEKQLQFIMDVSDRIEKEDDNSPLVRNLERDNWKIVSKNWHNSLSKNVQQDLRSFRSYKGHSVKDLLRAIRNKKHHYRELPDDVRKEYGRIPNEYVTYFTSRFPFLLIHTFKVMALCADESIFWTYYPEESKSFCGRALRDELADDFISTVQGSPRKVYIEKTSPSNLINGHPAAGDRNWRQTPPLQPVTIPSASPGINSGISEVKKRRRRRRTPFQALASTLEASEHGERDGSDQDQDQYELED